MDNSLNISAIIKRIQKKTGLNQTQVAVQLFDKTIKALNNQIRNNSIDWDKLYKWAIHEKVDLNWLIAGYGTNDTQIYSVVCRNDGEYKIVPDSGQEPGPNIEEPCNMETIQWYRNRIERLERKIDSLEAKLEGNDSPGPLKKGKAMI